MGGEGSVERRGGGGVGERAAAHTRRQGSEARGRPVALPTRRSTAKTRIKCGGSPGHPGHPAGHPGHPEVTQESPTSRILAMLTRMQAPERWWNTPVRTASLSVPHSQCSMTDGGDGRAGVEGGAGWGGASTRHRAPGAPRHPRRLQRLRPRNPSPLRRRSLRMLKVGQSSGSEGRRRRKHGMKGLPVLDVTTPASPDLGGSKQVRRCSGYIERCSAVGYTALKLAQQQQQSTAVKARSKAARSPSAVPLLRGSSTMLLRQE
jgi:hypothetical protein